MTHGQKDSISQRTVLLATDHSQSIIGEIVDGKANAIAYSAYGHQSAQQDVTTRLGFNGQLREMQTSWYLLGNGYRAYNPRLMRFHSPDSWSPFNGGGLNAYMYCVGDPVNRSDPTGHFPWKALLFGNKKYFNFYGVKDVPDSAMDIMARMSPEKTGELGALLGAGMGAVTRAPRPGGISSTPIGNSPGLGDHAPTTLKHHPGFAQGAAMDGLTAMGRGETRLVGGGGGGGWGMGRPGSTGSTNGQVTVWSGKQYEPRFENDYFQRSGAGNSRPVSNQAAPISDSSDAWALRRSQERAQREADQQLRRLNRQLDYLNLMDRQRNPVQQANRNCRIL